MKLAKLVACAAVALAACNGEGNDPTLPIDLVISVDSLAVTEGASATFEVTLDGRPTAAVTVELTATGGATASPPTLAFAPSDFDVAQIVTVSAPQDLDLADDTGQVALAGADGTATVDVLVHDDDTQAIVASASPVAVTEGGTATFTVEFPFVPAADTTVTIATLDPGVATVTPATLTFTASNYATPQTVTVTGTQDQNLAPNVTMARLTADSLAMHDVEIDVVDDDHQQIILGMTNVVIPEGEQIAIPVSLAYDPGAPVTLEISSDNPTAIGPQPTMVTFTSATYATPVNVVIGAVRDRNAIDESAAITFYQPLTTTMATLTASIDDNYARAGYGWPVYLDDVTLVAPGPVVAYKVTGVVPGQLDTLGIVAASWNYPWRMAVYRDSAGVPGALVADTGPVGPSEFSSFVVINPINLTAGDYWIALRVEGQTWMHQSTGPETTTACTATTEIPDIQTPYPATFGAATCATVLAQNVWIDTLL